MAVDTRDRVGKSYGTSLHSFFSPTHSYGIDTLSSYFLSSGIQSESGRDACRDGVD